MRPRGPTGRQKRQIGFFLATTQKKKERILGKGLDPKKQKQMHVAALYDVLADPTVVSVNVRFCAESTAELHAGLVSLYMHCLSRLLGAVEMSSIMRTDTDRVAALFAKFGVACHLDGEPAPPESELAGHVVCVALASRSHTLQFSFAPLALVSCHESERLGRRGGV